MKTLLNTIFLLSSVFILSIGMVQAASIFDISYPIAELGNCGSQEECKAFCNDSANAENCQLWAENNGFAPKRETMAPPQGGPMPGDRPAGGDRAREMKDEEAFANAPGGCKTPRECDMYCRVDENLRECMDYGVKYGYMSQEEADKILAQSKKGGPGGCKSEAECNKFCRDSKNARECMKFVVDEGKITQEEADIMITQMEKGPGGKPGKPMGKGHGEPKIQEEKAKAALATKAGPGGCKTVEECSAYCMGGEHQDECMKFAEENDLMDPAEMEMAKKMMAIGGPGGCKGPKECDDFCGSEENRDTCFNFAKDNGMMSGEEVQMMEKQMSIIKKLDRQAGPGGCKTREECNAFCKDSANLETCINFSGKQGIISGDAAKKMMGQTRDAKMKMQQIGEYQNFRGMDGQMMGGPMGGPNQMDPNQQGGQMDGQNQQGGQRGGIRGFFGNFFGGQEPGDEQMMTPGDNNMMGPPQGDMPSEGMAPGTRQGTQPGNYQGGMQPGQPGNQERRIDPNGTEGRTMQQQFTPPEGMTKEQMEEMMKQMQNQGPTQSGEGGGWQMMGQPGEPGQRIDMVPQEGMGMGGDSVPPQQGGTMPGNMYVAPQMPNNVPSMDAIRQIIQGAPQQPMQQQPMMAPTNMISPPTIDGGSIPPPPQPTSFHPLKNLASLIVSFADLVFGK